MPWVLRMLLATRICSSRPAVSGMPEPPLARQVLRVNCRPPWKPLPVLVDQLPPCQADLIRRAFIRGQTHHAMAEATGLPLGTVKSRIRLALEKLRSGMRSATLADVDG